MAASTHLVAVLAVVCCLAAVVPVSAGTPVASSTPGPDDPSDPPKMEGHHLTVEEQTLLLQKFFSEASREIFAYLKNLAKQKIAEDTDDDLPGSEDLVPRLLGRFRREPDSPTGGHHEHHPEVHAAHPATVPTAGVPGYPPAIVTPSLYAAVVPTPVVVGEIHHHYSTGAPVPVPVIVAVPAAPAQYAPPPPKYAPPPQYAAPPPQYAAPPPQYAAPPPQYAVPPPQYAAPPPQYAAPPQSAPPHQYAPLYAPPAARVPQPVYWSQPPAKAKSFPEIWELFITKPLEESYNDFLAYIPVNALYSLAFEHQYLDFESLRAYTANRFGFISAMQNVFHAPSEQLGEIGRFFDMMTRVLPTRFFGEGRSVDDLLREIRLYFAVNYPLLQFLAPPRNVTTTHYYAK